MRAYTSTLLSQALPSEAWLAVRPRLAPCQFSRWRVTGGALLKCRAAPRDINGTEVDEEGRAKVIWGLQDHSAGGESTTSSASAASEVDPTLPSRTAHQHDQQSTSEDEEGVGNRMDSKSSSSNSSSSNCSNSSNSRSRSSSSSSSSDSSNSGGGDCVPSVNSEGGDGVRSGKGGGGDSVSSGKSQGGDGVSDGVGSGKSEGGEGVRSGKSQGVDGVSDGVGSGKSEGGDGVRSGKSQGGDGVGDGVGSSKSEGSEAGVPSPQDERGGMGGVPHSVLVISFVSAALTMSSCVFNTLLPIYMVSELKMSMHSMGMFEGFLEAFSYIVRMFSGVVSDMMTSRKGAITLGLAMGASAKFGMSAASSVTQLFTAKAIDRLANGVQAAPRDALISDLAPESSRSACFGFAQSMRKWGSAVGASMVFVLMKATNNNYQLIFLMAATVSAMSYLAFVVFVPNHVRPKSDEEKASSKQKLDSSGGKSQPKEGLQLSKLAKDVVMMGADFYRMLAVIAAYTMCHINESMLEARALEVGFGKAESSLVVALLAGAIFIMAYPLGRLDDRFGPRVTFAVGIGALILGNLTLTLSTIIPHAVFASLLFLGAHWAIIQGPMLAIVAGYAPPHLRGTAFGIFYSMMALTAIISNTLFGAVWTKYTALHAFALSATMATTLLIALPHVLPASTRRGDRWAATKEA